MNFLQVLFLVLAGVLVIITLAKTYLKHSVNYCTSKRRLHGKVAIVTGATSGIGYETARNLAKRGAKVILACRNLKAGEQAADKIKTECRNKNVKAKKLDLSLMASVREFCGEILQEESRLDILVNNAGVALIKKEMTPEGNETHYATNHLGPFLLTNLLLGLMIETGACPRIVTLSSTVHNWVKSLDFENLNSEESYDSTFIYAKSKLYNVLFTNHLHELLSKANIKISTYAVHPGVVQTELFRNAKKVLLWNILLRISNAFFKTPWEGAQTSIHVAVSEDVEEGMSGLYWANCKNISPSLLAQDKLLAQTLWEISMEHSNILNSEYHLPSNLVN